MQINLKLIIQDPLLFGTFQVMGTPHINMLPQLGVSVITMPGLQAKCSSE